MPPEIDVIILQSIRCCLIWPVAWVPQLNPITAEWIRVWINPFIIPTTPQSVICTVERLADLHPAQTGATVV